MIRKLPLALLLAVLATLAVGPGWGGRGATWTAITPELEPAAEPVPGRISVDGTSNEFLGWLALMDVLAARLADAHAGQTREQA